MRYFLLFFLVLLVACGTSDIERCDTASDCVAKPRSAFSASCIDGECVYAPIPGVKGNGICDANENKCTAPEDCGVCAGKVAGTANLVQACVEGKCVQDVNPDVVETVYLTNDVGSFGDTYRVETVYSSPFNLKKDLYSVTISLADKGDFNSDHRIMSAELKGVMPDRRTVVIADARIDRAVWEGQPVSKDLVLSFPSAVLEGQLSNILLTVRYSFSSRGNSMEKSFQVRNVGVFQYVNPDSFYPCPDSCDDGNPGTRDYCGPQTDYFCKHDPIPGVCGNYICEAGENKCTCPRDCGPCSGSAGSFTDYACRNDECVGVLKPGVSVEPNNIFDERTIGPVRLTTTYGFNNPLNVNDDKIRIDFSTDEDFTIETIRLLERNQILGEKAVDAQAGVVEVPLDDISDVEEEHAVSVGVWYSYDVDGQERSGQFSKSLGRITFVDVR